MVKSDFLPFHKEKLMYSWTNRKDASAVKLSYSRADLSIAAVSSVVREIL